MKRTVTSAVLQFIVLLPIHSFAQSPQLPADTILGYEIQGITGLMTPDDARSALLNAGFSEKRDGEDWGKVPTATFTRDEVTVALTHLDGEIIRINETRLSRGESLDYADDVERIRAHFGKSAEAGCVEQDYGTRCGFRGAGGSAARFSASLTPQMIFIQLSSEP